MDKKPYGNNEKGNRDIKLHILVAGAVYREISAIADKIKSHETGNSGGRKTICGLIGSKKVVLLVTGPGIVNTARALTREIEKNRPNLIIMTGCAGAFPGTGLNIGDLAIATKETDVHLGVEGKNMPDPLPFSILSRRGRKFKNSYPADWEYIKIAWKILKPECEKEKINLKMGPFITVSTITATKTRVKHLYAAFRPLMESMEGSAAAHIALYYDIPFLEIRAASNMAGQRDKKKWNLPLAFDRCAGAVCCLLEKIRMKKQYDEKKAYPGIFHMP